MLYLEPIDLSPSLSLEADLSRPCRSEGCDIFGVVPAVPAPRAEPENEFPEAGPRVVLKSGDVKGRVFSEDDLTCRGPVEVTLLWLLSELESGETVDASAYREDLLNANAAADGGDEWFAWELGAVLGGATKASLERSTPVDVRLASWPVGELAFGDICDGAASRSTMAIRRLSMTTLMLSA